MGMQIGSFGSNEIMFSRNGLIYRILSKLRTNNYKNFGNYMEKIKLLLFE